MEKYSFAGKIARPAVASPALTRPDWSAIRPRDPGLIWLDKNENIDPELAAITSKILAQLPVTALYSYPDSGPFYHRLGNYLRVGADHLLLAAGSDGVIRSVFEAFINPGDVVVHTATDFRHVHGLLPDVWSSGGGNGIRTFRPRPLSVGGPSS